MKPLAKAILCASVTLSWGNPIAVAQGTVVGLMPEPERSQPTKSTPVPGNELAGLAVTFSASLPGPGRNAVPRSMDPNDPFIGHAELPLSRLVEAVLARNPTRQAALAAWQAAVQRYPQAVSLDDPMFAFMVGPGAWGSEFDGAYMLEASQRLPWPKKRSLRGAAARAEASALGFEVGEAELMLVEAAKLSFLDYYLARKQLALNDDNTRIVREFRATANAKYQTNLVTQQDVLQADVELADLTRRKFELERMELVAAARINTLLHRGADYPLPPPPPRLPPPDPLPPVEVLQQIALRRRPDLAARGSRIRAEQASLALARREFYPDLEIVGRYDAFWQEDPLRTAVGMTINVPLYTEKRRAAVREAAFRLNQQRWELELQIDAIRNDVQAAHTRLVESLRTTELYRATLLPVARRNVESALSGYVAATLDFLRLLEAQRQYLMLRERSYEAETELHRRLAELERVVGGPLVDFEAAEELPPASRE